MTDIVFLFNGDDDEEEEEEEEEEVVWESGDLDKDDILFCDKL